MRIAQVSAAQTAGGAERVAVDMHESFLAAGHEAVLLTPRPDDDGGLAGVIGVDVHGKRSAVLRALSGVDARLARPWASWRRRRGYDDLHHPWTAGLLDLLPWVPDVLHLHNLHGGWFDLRCLSALSQRVPTVITLHDAFLLTGGAHFPCLADGVGGRVLRSNREQRIAAWSGAKLHVVAPSQWMLDRVVGSELEGAAASQDVIANGVDTEVFRPIEKTACRDYLGADWSGDGMNVLGVGLTGRRSATHKDPGNLVKAFGLLRSWFPGSRLWLLGGEGKRDERLDAPGVVQLPAVADRETLARFYGAADVVVHSASEDNHPLTVLEAMACGAAVVSTDQGGMLEQIDHERTGLLVPAGDAAAMAGALRGLLESSDRRAVLGAAALKQARDVFSRQRMAADYLALYGGVV